MNQEAVGSSKYGPCTCGTATLTKNPRKRLIFSSMLSSSFSTLPPSRNLALAPDNLSHLSGSSFYLAEILRVAAKCTNERKNASKFRKREENSWIRVNGFGSNGSSFSKLVHSLEDISSPWQRSL